MDLDFNLDLDKARLLLLDEMEEARLCPYYMALFAIQLRFELAGLMEHYRVLQRARIHFWTGGKDSEHVLLIHGFGHNALLTWNLQAIPLSHDFRLVLPDLLWFGKSTSETRDPTVGFQVKNIMELMDSLSIERFHVVGISYGGLIAANLANDHPDRILKLVLVNSPATTMRPGDYSDLLKRTGLKHIRDLMFPEDIDGLRRNNRMMYRYPPHLPLLVLEDIRRHMMTGDR